MKLGKMIFATTLVTMLGALSAQFALAKPPLPEPAEKTWQLDIRFKKPTPISYTNSQGKQETCWYFQFSLTNSTDEDIHPFQPEIFLYTDTGELLRANRGVDTVAAFKRFQQIAKDKLITKLRVGQKILQGEDNAQEMVVFFKDFDPSSGGFKIFFGGLSGETTVLKLPEPIKRKIVDRNGKLIEEEVSEIILRKTLELRYKLSTEAASRSFQTTRYLGKKWIMR